MDVKENNPLMAKGVNLSARDIEELLDSEELDHVKAVLAKLLMHSTDMDIDTVCSLVFKDGDRITWH